MKNRILGLHHITAIAGNAKRNLDFYTGTLGLRLVKRTVNFDDPGTYHFYFGDEVGTPGTILTFFPWEGIRKGRRGTGLATEVGYTVPPGSLPFWKKRFDKHLVTVTATGERFGQKFLSIDDPDGLGLTLIEGDDPRRGWETKEVAADAAIRGFHNATLTLRNAEPTAKVLTDVLGYRLHSNEGSRARYTTDAVEGASVIDLISAPTEASALNAAGTVHHIAFRVRDEEVLMEYRKKVESSGLSITPKIDRNYFFSVYFREPGGVLFEIATDNPGFSVDEPVAELGKGLKLPAQYEHMRDEIEKALPQI